MTAVYLTPCGLWEYREGPCAPSVPEWRGGRSPGQNDTMPGTRGARGGVTCTAGPRGAEHRAGGLHSVPTLTRGPQACLFCGGRNAGPRPASEQWGWTAGRGGPRRGVGAGVPLGTGRARARPRREQGGREKGARPAGGQAAGRKGGRSTGSGHGFSFLPRFLELRVGARLFLSLTFCKGGPSSCTFEDSVSGIESESVWGTV